MCPHFYPTGYCLAHTEERNSLGLHRSPKACQHVAFIDMSCFNHQMVCFVVLRWFLNTTFMSFPLNRLHKEVYRQHASISAPEALVQVISVCFVPLAYIVIVFPVLMPVHTANNLSKHRAGVQRINLCQESHISAQNSARRLLMKILSLYILVLLQILHLFMQVNH